MILRVDIDFGLSSRSKRTLTDRIKFFQDDDWFDALLQIAAWVKTLPVQPETIRIEDRTPERER